MMDNKIPDYLLNIIKNRLNEHVEEEMVEEQCGFRRDVAVPMLYSGCNR